MQKTIQLILCIFIVVAVLTSCERPDDVLNDASTNEIAQKDLVNILRQLEGHWNSGQIHLMKPFYADKIIQMPPNQPPVIGRRELFDRWEAYLDQFYDQWKPYVDSISISGDLAVIRGGFTQRSAPKSGGDGIAMHAKSIQVFERNLQGDWQMTMDIWNALEPRQYFNDAEHFQIKIL